MPGLFNFSHWSAEGILAFSLSLYFYHEKNEVKKKKKKTVQSWQLSGGRTS